MSWSATQYTKFEDERDRSSDLWNAMNSPRERERIERARPLTDAA